MPNLIYNTLQELGLEDKEIKIYLALLEIGEATVLNISRKSKVNRASIYYILEKMKKKGLVTHVEKSGKETFAATEPALLLNQQKSKVQNLKSIIPDLKHIHTKNDNKPNVKFYEGIEGIKTVYQDTLTAKTEILDYANSKQIRDHWPKYDEEYINQRTKKKIPLRCIAPNDEYGEQVKHEDSKHFRQTRLINPKDLNLNDEIKIYDNKIAMISFEKLPFAVIIESETLANTQRAIFEMAWSFAMMNTNT